MSEVITSFNLNITNGPSGQTASVSSVIGGKDFEGTIKGTPQLVFTDLGNALQLTDPDLNTLIQNFVATDVATTKGTTSTTKQYNLQDKLSLDLDSIVLLVRGQNCSPTGDAVFSDWVANWTEIPVNRKRASQAAANPSFGTQPAATIDRSLIIGQIYNTVTISDDNKDPYSKVFQNGIYKPEFSQNPKGIVTDPVTELPALPTNHSDVKWADSEMKFGYTLKELIDGLALFSITVEGLDPLEDILLLDSGKLKSVLSSVASKFGLYMKIDGINNKVIFIGPDEIANATVTDLTQSLDNCITSSSYSESNLIQTKAISYSANIDSESYMLYKSSFSGGGGSKNYRKPFYLVRDTSPIASGTDLEKALHHVCGYLFLLHHKKALEANKVNNLFGILKHEGQLSQGMLDALKLGIGAIDTDIDKPFDDGGRNVIDDPEFFSDTEKGLIKKAKGNGVTVYYNSLADGVGTFSNEWNKLPFISLISAILDNGVNGMYISSPMTKYRALRTDITDPTLQILSSNDPDFQSAIKGDTLLEDIEGLETYREYIKNINRLENLNNVNDLYKAAGGANKPVAPDENKYYFIGFRDYFGGVFDVDKNTVIEVLGEDNFGTIDKGPEGSFTSIKNVNAVGSYANKSKAVLVDAQGPRQDTLSIGYKKLRDPINLDPDPEDDGQDNPNGGGGGGGSTSSEEIFTNRDFRTYDLLTLAGATNLNPHELVMQEGSENELLAYKANVILNSLLDKRVKSSSAEYEGLVIPDTTDITLNSMGVNFTSTGIKTSIKHSTKQLLPMDEQIIVDRYNNAVVNRPVLTRDAANRKNFLGM